MGTTAKKHLEKLACYVEQSIKLQWWEQQS